MKKPTTTFKPNTDLEKHRAAIPEATDALAQMWVPIAIAHPLWMPSICGLEWLIWDFGMADSPYMVPTACTDGYKVWVNPTFFLGLTPGQRVALVCHELLHPLLNHLYRLAQHREDLRNIAADYEINNMLADYMSHAPTMVARMEELPGWIQDAATNENFKGMACEAIAVSLAKKIPPPQQQQGSGQGQGQPQQGQGQGQPQQGQGQGQSGMSEAEEFAAAASGAMCSSPGEFTAPADAAAAEKLNTKWTEIAANTANAARLAGNAPGSWVEKLERRLEAPVDMAALLERYMAELLPDDDGERFHRPTFVNNEYLIPDDLVPSHGTLVFVKDTSGSVSTAEAESVLSCIEAAVTRLNIRRAVVLDVDTEVAAVQELVPGESISREFKGRGGTDFRPPFKWTADHAEEVKVLLYFTDGEGCFPSSAPDYPVIWINFNKRKVAYPFGDVIDISQFIDRGY